MKGPALLVGAVLAVLAFGASYALSADNGPEKKAGFVIPGTTAKPLKVSEASQLRTGGLNGSAKSIPGLSALPRPAAKKVVAAPAPAPAPAPRRRARRRPTPAPAPTPVVRTPAPAPVVRTPAPAPRPKPTPQPTFDDSG